MARLAVAAIVVAVVVGAVVAGKHNDLPDHEEVEDKNRECPDGFFYAGEPEHGPSDRTRGSYWEKGPTSPLYSCYRFIQEEKHSFVGGSLKCNEFSAELVSVNDYLEQAVLTSYMFADQMTEDKERLEVFTSGIELSPGNWTWFGADEPVDFDAIVSGLEDYANDSVQCLAVRWGNNGTDSILVFSAVPCTHLFNTILCEVRVYTQTWYVWMYTNWLQMLFVFALGVLLITSCCLCQALLCRGYESKRGERGQNQFPPPYTPSQEYHQQKSKAAKYAKKSKEILAKVTLFKQREDEKVIVTDA